MALMRGPFMKTPLKVLIIVGGGIIAAILTIGIIALKIVPTSEDASISETIRRDFEESAKANVFTNRPADIISSPRVKGTMIYVHDDGLTDREKETLKMLANQIGQRTHRTITIVFR